MPYSYSAPEEYADLQALVHECLTVEDPLRRATALTDLLGLFDGGLAGLSDPHEFVVEFVSHIQARRFSCVAAEAEFVARLDMVKVTLDEFQAEAGTAGVPMLVGDVRWFNSLPRTIRAALGPLLAAVDELTRRPVEDLMAMPARERMAGIRLLRLFCLYGCPADRAPVKEARMHFLRTLGIPVWRVLSAPGFDALTVDSGMYGEPAMRRLELVLRDGTYADGDDETPDFIESDGPAFDLSDEPASEGPLWHTVVADKFPTPRDADDKAQLRQYEPLCQPMRVAPLPTAASLEEKHALLRTEFPWAEAVLAGLFDELKGRRAFGTLRLGFHPLLLVGPSGAGKSRMARRVAEVLGIDSMTTSLAGVTDAMCILGTARGWSSGQPSPLLKPLLKGCASVLMCFDEVDKAGDQARNSPSVQAALLSLLEPEEARRWRDPYLQVECDLRPMLFIFTCNDTTHLSAALRSRLRIMNVERPTSAQLMQVVPFVLRDIEHEWGLPSGALEGISIEQRALRGLSSLRDLKRAVAAAARVWISELASRHGH